jgi:uncharacterized protein with NRDE domain
MCLVAVLYRVIDSAPILVAANREERFDRPTLAPRKYRGPPSYVCGQDQQAGGTWLGVNQHGLLVAVTNRKRAGITASPRSRGLLCRDLLSCESAKDAVAKAQEELKARTYAGANYLCVDFDYGAVVHAGHQVEICDLDPGLHILTNGDLNDPDDRVHTLSRRLIDPDNLKTMERFIEVTAAVCAHKGVVIRHPDAGTVSSDQVAVTRKSQDAIYRHAPGPPDRLDYDDCSDLLRAVLSGSNRPDAG